jgi:hypothetical protein
MIERDLPLDRPLDKARQKGAVLLAEVLVFAEHIS